MVGWKQESSSQIRVQELCNNCGASAAWYLLQVPMATMWHKPFSLGSIDSFFLWLFLLRGNTFAYALHPSQMDSFMKECRMLSRKQVSRQEMETLADEGLRKPLDS